MGGSYATLLSSPIFPLTSMFAVVGAGLIENVRSLSYMVGCDSHACCGIVDWL